MEAAVYETGETIIDVEENEDGLGVDITTSSGRKFFGCYIVSMNDSGIDRDIEWIDKGPISVTIQFAYETKPDTRAWDALKSMF